MTDLSDDKPKIKSNRRKDVYLGIGIALLSLGLCMFPKKGALLRVIFFMQEPTEESLRIPWTIYLFLIGGILFLIGAYWASGDRRKKERPGDRRQREE